MTASYPDQIPSQEPSNKAAAGSIDHAAGSNDGPSATPRSKSTSSPLERARAAARKLLGRGRDKAKKDDPNIYPLF